MEDSKPTELPDESDKLRRLRREVEKLRTRESRLGAELETLREAYRQLAEKRMGGASKEERRKATAMPFVDDPEIRQWFYELSATFTPMVAVDNGESRFLVPTRNMGTIGRRLFTRGSYAGDTVPDVLRIATEAGSTVTPRGTVFDVGANIGTVVIPAVKEHGYERGVAFEAHPANAHILRLNVAHSDLADRVQIVDVALGANDGVAVMRAQGRSGGQRILKELDEEPVETAPNVVRVPVCRLDSLVERGVVDLETVTLLWMDVQGYESAVLQGASRLLEAPPLVVTEFWPQRLDAYGELASMLDIITGHFTHVVDLKTSLRAKRLHIFPVARMSEVVDRVGDRFTDLALLRLPSG